mmetsp:Transcript_24908/g.65684  ORF Transcript_24908/g.65684 Transcript_24908/m.65684 type:complete len:284 (+) Transcript_24908:64-915(+)
MRHLAFACLAFGASVADGRTTVVVSGATGQSGNLFYKRLKAENVSNVRAFVRNVTKAKDLLECDACDEAEGIFVGDVKDPRTLKAAMKGADVLAIFTSSAPRCGPLGPLGNCSYPPGAEPRAIDFLGTKNQLSAFASAGGSLKAKRVIYMSTMGTTRPDNFLDKLGNGQVSFYHLQAEVSIMSSGIPFTIAKACGLGSGSGGKRKLSVGHDDATFSFTHTVNRDDVARVLVEAVRHPDAASGLRFDICSDWFGSPTTDIVKDVFGAAKYPWDIVGRFPDGLVV